MNAIAYSNQKSAAAPPTPKPEVRQAVKELLTQSPAFARLPAATQQQVACNTALIADYLAAPEGIPGNSIPGGIAMPPATALETPKEATWEERQQAVKDIGDKDFEAGAAREGVEVAGQLMNKVNFPVFVASLIEGVFHSIVKASIEQMEAYAALVASVSKSLQQFRDENVTENQGRDHVAEKFPDMFEIGVDDFGDQPGPRLKLREGVEESDALKRVNSSLSFEDGALKSMDLSDENVEKALVIAARTQLARQRQQLLASLVLMGINRIVITDGRISAKIMYDFQARDSRKLARSATAYDYARDQYGNLQTVRKGESERELTNKGVSNVQWNKDGGGTSQYNADYYSKGSYKYEDKPVMTAMSTATEASESSLQTRAQLSGAVEVNFKSDYLPLDKMATPGMIAAIQGNSTPVDPNVVPSARNPQSPPTQAGQAQPSPTPTPTA